MLGEKLFSFDASADGKRNEKREIEIIARGDKRCL